MPFDRYLVCPVFIGDEKTVRSIAKVLYFRYGFHSRYFSSSRICFFTKCLPFLKSYRLPPFFSASLLKCALIDLATDQGWRDNIPVLFLCEHDEKTKKNVLSFDQSQLEELETFYLILHPGDEEQLFQIIQNPEKMIRKEDLSDD